MTRRGAATRVNAVGQLALPMRERHGWGGRRAGAGRKPSGRAGVPHRARPEHRRPNPVHATLRARREVGSLRAPRVVAQLREALARASRGDFRVVHYSVQADHVHLLVEGDERQALSHGLWGLAVRLARGVNRATGRRGPVWADRYHARALRTPQEVRNALVYVLMNWKKHDRWALGIDPCSSGRWFDGWKGVLRVIYLGSSPPVAPAQTWLLRVGWRRHGRLTDPDCPRS
jgi:putative transposase